MTRAIDEPTAEAQPEEPEPPSPVEPKRGGGVGLVLLRIVAAVAITVGILWVLGKTFGFLRNTQANRLLIVLTALAVGVGGVFFLFWAGNWVIKFLPERLREGVRPYVFVGPCLVILGVFLVYPVINTIIISFKDATSSGFVGLDNYKFVFTDSGMLTAIRNTFGWIVFVPLVATSVGLVFAMLADRLRRGEAFAKSMIFLPLAISFAGASIVWNFIYSYRPQGFGSNVGLLNAIVIGLGKHPIAWLDSQPWNNLLLMVIMVWMQTGFAMVVLSAAIKSVPEEIVEAARIDGATEFQLFRRIITPVIWPTIVVVLTYMIINAMKVFDIVFVMGNTEGRGTQVIAERMITWFFVRGDNGKGAAVAVVLFVAIIPVMIYNVRRFREQERIR